MREFKYFLSSTIIERMPEIYFNLGVNHAGVQECTFLKDLIFSVGGFKKIFLLLYLRVYCRFNVQ